MGAKKPPRVLRPADQIVIILQRRAKVWALRVNGLSIRHIATELKCGVATVHSDLKAERVELTQEASDEIASHKATLIAREEALIETHWPMRHDPDSAKIVQASDKMIAQLSGALIVRNELTGRDGAPLGPTVLSLYTDEQLARIARGQPAGTASDGDPRDPTTGTPQD